MKEAKTIDMTPSPIAYKRMLEFIIEWNPHAEHQDWARSELDRIQPDGVLVEEWDK